MVTDTEDSLLASDHGLRLTSEQDALDVLSSGLQGCVFELSDLIPEYFDLANGIAGATFQKFINYGFRVAFVIPEPESCPIRLQELIKDHARHTVIRFFKDVESARLWLRSE
ncbi:MAG: DUF4180 domain-containing protein [Pseudomonadales bacterium]|nr:DUF4180 domain-containing protein [Pseudomonadales bacterium]